MKKTKFHRLLALVLATALLVGGALSVSAASVGMIGSTTNKTLAEIKEQLNAISYEAYVAKNADVPRATSAVLIAAAQEGIWSFEKGVSGDEAEVKVMEDGSVALYTPASGTTTWKVTIPAAGKYSIVIEYWPDQAKAASIERILKINDEIPFAQARYLTLPKIWNNKYVSAQVSDEFGVSGQFVSGLVETIRYHFYDSFINVHCDFSFIIPARH